MKPPLFWNFDSKRFSLASTLLRPLGWLYAKGTARRLKNGPRTHLPIPVICVGNINLGGTGKTPTVIHLVQRLQEMGKKPVVVSRGYGGEEKGPLLVDPMQHDADRVGDEPLLLAGFGPVIVAKDRGAGADLAVRTDADILVIDDGLQNPALHYDLTITVVDAKIGFGNERVVPAGPLREPVRKGLQRSDLLLVIGKGQRTFEGLDFPVVRAHLEPLKTGMDWSDLRVYAFAGIGRPEKFYDSLRSLNASIIKTRSFGDHQKIPVPILKRMETDATQLAAQLVTTEKDAARLPQSYRTKVLTLPVRLTVQNSKVFDQKLSDLF